MDTLCGIAAVLFFVLFLLGLVGISIKAAEDKKLRDENPEVWLRQQELRLRQKEIEDAQKQREHDRTKTNIGIGSTFGQIILKSLLK